MKKIIYLFVAILALYSCQSSDNLKFGGLNGEVEKITDKEYEAISKFGEVIQGELKYDGVTLYEYNKDGKLIKMENYYSDGELRFSNQIEWSGDRQASSTLTTPTSKSISKPISDKKNAEIFVNEKYDDKGNIINRDSISMFYDNHNRVIKQIQKESSGNNIIIENKFDSDSHIIEFKVSNSLNEVLQQYTSIFDKEGREIKRSFLYESGRKSENSYSYEYKNLDDKGNWIEKITYNNGNPESVTIREIKYMK